MSEFRQLKHEIADRTDVISRSLGEVEYSLSMTQRAETNVGSLRDQHSRVVPLSSTWWCAPRASNELARGDAH